MVKGDVSSRGGPPKEGPYEVGVDYQGGDIAPCSHHGTRHPPGCMLANSTHLDCEAMCNSTTGCVGYVFANASCTGKPGGMCWTKGAMHTPSASSCRDSRVLVPQGSVPGHWAIKGGDAQEGPLKVYFDGKRAPGYAPMRKQGAIVLGIGGDNSDGSVGTFYEGVMTSGYSLDTTDDKIQANIVAAGYGKVSPNQPALPDHHPKLKEAAAGGFDRSAGCSSDEGCSLLGTCSAGSMECTCDPGWTGDNCARADLLPYRPTDGYINRSAASWGGRPIFFGSKWHLFATEIARKCPLILFMNNSMVVRATATEAAGPYTHQEVVLPTFHHNPTAVGPTPDGYFLIFSIGTDDPEPIDCTYVSS
jgi:hypothetical protein